ncbi:Hypothetical_protein [Hexamita inflata]|uniref:Hypothetical_protein n=1 Tax=Hexamita inflata TaxID=28002 RepID=A0AA86NAS7_9EUKA|nr:Hypothetical protein HINF_LOCUS3894 [Hexamita inflata]
MLNQNYFESNSNGFRFFTSVLQLLIIQLKTEGLIGGPQTYEDLMKQKRKCVLCQIVFPNFNAYHYHFYEQYSKEIRKQQMRNVFHQIYNQKLESNFYYKMVELRAEICQICFYPIKTRRELIQHLNDKCCCKILDKQKQSKSSGKQQCIHQHFCVYNNTNDPELQDFDDTQKLALLTDSRLLQQCRIDRLIAVYEEIKNYNQINETPESIQDYINLKRWLEWEIQIEYYDLAICSQIMKTKTQKFLYTYKGSNLQASVFEVLQYTMRQQQRFKDRQIILENADLQNQLHPVSIFLFSDEKRLQLINQEKVKCAIILAYLENKVQLIKQQLDKKFQVEIQKVVYTLESPLVAIWDMYNIDNTFNSLLSIKRRCQKPYLWGKDSFYVQINTEIQQSLTQISVLRKNECEKYIQGVSPTNLSHQDKILFSNEVINQFGLKQEFKTKLSLPIQQIIGPLVVDFSITGIIPDSIKNEITTAQERKQYEQTTMPTEYKYMQTNELYRIKYEIYYELLQNQQIDNNIQ